MSRSTSPRKLYHTRSQSQTQSQSFTPTSSYPTTPIRNPTFDYLTSTLQSPEEHVSPTKALALSRLQHDISQIQVWLEVLFAPSAVPPRFLKWRDEAIASASGELESGLIVNDGSLGLISRETSRQANGGNVVLDALKALKQANLAADHLNSLVHDAEKEELKWLMQQQDIAKTQSDGGSKAKLLADQLLSALSDDGYEALKWLSESAEELGLRVNVEDDTNSLQSLFILRMLESAQQRFVLQQQSRELESIQKRIELRLNADKEILSHDKHASQGEVREDTYDEAHIRAVQLNRDTKQINLKIMEYEDRARGLERQLDRIRPGNASLRDVIEARTQLEERKSRVRDLQSRFTMFNGLPPDLDASRSEVKRAMEELETLKKQRETLFEKIGRG